MLHPARTESKMLTKQSTLDNMQSQWHYEDCVRFLPQQKLLWCYGAHCHCHIKQHQHLYSEKSKGLHLLKL